MDFKKQIQTYLELEIETIKKLDVRSMNQAMKLIEETYLKEGTIYIFGNGGSSATASHFENDFNKGVSEHLDKKFHFRCLNDNLPTIMAIANDIGFEEVFRFQLKGDLKPEDIIIAISGSGNSENVLNAVEYAIEQGNRVIGLTGFDGGRLKELCDISMHVPIGSMQVTEDIHMIFDHLMMSIFCRILAGREHLFIV
jgi:D-sedoheptulose 7-phosphate isomerase